MPCNQLQDAACASAIAADSLSPDNSSQIIQMVNSSFMEDWFEKYRNNLQGYNGNYDSESGITFNLTPFLKAICKAYELTGDTSLVTLLEEKIDNIFSKNDQSLVAENLLVTNAAGVLGPIVPYQECATPAGFDLNNPYCGWSRWAPSELSTSCPEARARPELLTDGGIICGIMDAILCMKECGSLNTAKSETWLNKIKSILDVWDVEWKENYIPTSTSMGPLCNGTETYTVTGQYVDRFDKTYPLNQQAVMIKADMLYQKCRSDRTGALDRARRLIIDWNDHYFTVDNNGNDTGWYYTSYCNACREQYEDLGHSQISLEFLKFAGACGVSGADTTLKRALDSLKANAMISNSDMWWYNNADPSHGTLANNTDKGPWIGTTAALCDPAFDYSSGSGGQPQLYRGVLLFSDLPEPMHTDCQNERQGLMQAWTSTDSVVGTGDELSAVFCYMQSLCGSRIIPEIIDGGGGDGICVSGESCDFLITSSDKNQETLLEFGLDEQCIDFGRSAAKLSYQKSNDDILKNKQCGITSKACLAPHETCFVWCNLCLHDTAVVSATNTVNGSPENLCECEDGLYWNFSTTYNRATDTSIPASYKLNVTGDEGDGCYADTVIIWNHDLCNGNTNFIELFVDGEKIADHVVDPNCKHCCGENDECNPIYFYLDEGAKGIDWELVFHTKAGYVHCIANISFGVTYPIELEVGFENIFNASRYKRKNTSSTCGWMPSVLEEKEYQIDIELTDLDECSLIDNWAPFIWYADRYPFYFIFSKNNYPEQIARVRLTSDGVEPSVYSDEICQTLTIPLELRRHPPRKTSNFNEGFTCKVENGSIPVIEVFGTSITNVISFTELTGIEDTGLCQIVDANFLENVDLGSISPSSSGDSILVSMNTTAGVRSKFSYEIMCNNEVYTCEYYIQTL